MREFIQHIRPIPIHECIGEHRTRPLAKVGTITFLNRFSASILSLVSTVILSRLLLPEAFGMVAMLSFFVALFGVICGPGFLDSAVQAKHLSIPQLNGLFWINLTFSLLFGGAMITVANTISKFYKIPGLESLAIAFAVRYIFESALAPHRMLLQRSMRAEIALLSTLLPQIIGLSCGIALALQNFGVWALFYSSAITAAVETICLIYFIRWIPGKSAKLDELKSFIQYGLKSSLGHISSYISLNAHTVALGHLASAVQVGVYNRAASLFQYPAQQISGPLISSIFPTMSAQQADKKAVSSIVLRSNWLSGFVLLPFSVIIIVFGDWIIPWLIGHNWTDAGSVIRLIAISQIPIFLNLALAKGNAAIGRPARAIGVSLISLPVLILGVCLTAPNGAIAVTAFLALFRWCTYPFFTWINLKGSGFEQASYIKNSVRLILFTATSIILTYPLRGFGEDSNLAAKLSILIMANALCGTVFYFGYRSCTTGRFILNWIYDAFGERLHIPRCFSPSHQTPQ